MQTLRPAYLYKELEEACPIKKEVIGDNGFDMIIVRELTGGLYFGERKTIEEDGVKKAIDTLSYNENEIRRIAIKAFDIAMKTQKESHKRRQGKRSGFFQTLEKSRRRSCKGLPGSNSGAYAG